MSFLTSEETSDTLRETVASLCTPITQLPTLLSSLCAPLNALGLLPRELREYNTAPLPKIRQSETERWIPTIQAVILQHVVPSWEVPLEQDGLSLVLDQYFCPLPAENPTAKDVALHAYSSLLSPPILPYAMRMLAQLALNFPIEKLVEYVFSKDDRAGKATLQWEACVRAIVSVPAKIANAANPSDKFIPPELEYNPYVGKLCDSLEIMVWDACTLNGHGRTSNRLQALQHFFTKLIQTGAFPSYNGAQSSTAFFTRCLPQIRRRLRGEFSIAYSAAWSLLIEGLSSSAAQSALSSLVSSLPSSKEPLSVSLEARQLVKRQSMLLASIFGTLAADQSEKWALVAGTLIGRAWNEHNARVLVCWAAGPFHGASVDEKALAHLVTRILEVWASPQHVKFSTLSQHQYLTALFLLTLSNLPPKSPYLTNLATSPQLLSCIGTYISHMDPAVRRCGMAVAEYIATSAGKKLNFGDWEGVGQGREWVMRVRALMKARDVDVEDPTVDSDADDQEDAIISPPTNPATTLPAQKASKRGKPPPPPRIIDSDDESLSGYASSDVSSRAPSPTPSELDEIEKDPTLRTGPGLNKKKVTRPVYLADLGELLKPGKGDAEGDFEKVDMGLTYAEELVRRKMEYGTELDENAVNLTIALVGLQDNFDMDSFDERRQLALNALVACCPQKAAPCIIEQFFHNQYSTTQRVAMLSALALGARELAALPIPPSPVVQSGMSTFPSKILPAAQHRKYITVGDIGTLSGGAQVAQIAGSISRLSLDKGRERGEEKVPEIVREKQLRIRRKLPNHAIVEVDDNEIPHGSTPIIRRTTKASFKDVAAEHFVMPLINRFWLHLRDEQARETRSVHFASGYRGGGTGMILDTMVLSHFLSTLAVLMHAARHSPAYLPILSPEALELAVTLGTRPMTTRRDEDTAEKDAAVLASALELALVIFDACIDLDGGKTLGLEHTPLVFSVNDWAGEVFRKLEETGARIEGAGGEAVNRVRRGSAGLLLRIEEVMDRWRRSMITM